MGEITVDHHQQDRETEEGDDADAREVRSTDETA